jgi:hypothetical protein
MLDKIKLLLDIATDEKDELILLLIALCKDEATEFCNLEEYSNKLDSAVIEMVIEKYNRRGSEGLSASTSSGVKEDYISSYSDAVLRKLRKNRKVKCV